MPKNITIRLSDAEIAKLTKIKLDHGIKASDIFRQALEAKFLIIYPPYNQSRKHQESVKSDTYISNQDWADQNLKDIYHYTDSAGIDWVLWRKLGNMIGATKLANIRDWVKNDIEYGYHVGLAGGDHIPYEAVLTDPLEHDLRKILKDQYRLDIDINQ